MQPEVSKLRLAASLSLPLVTCDLYKMSCSMVIVSLFEGVAYRLLHRPWFLALHRRPCVCHVYCRPCRGICFVAIALFTAVMCYSKLDSLLVKGAIANNSVLLLIAFQ